MPPRQKTTFNKKGKGTTTYKEYNPAQERASSRLERFIRDNPAGDDRNTAQSSVQQVIADMPQKFKDRTFKDFTGINYNDMTQGQKMIFDFYDNRNKYQRDMNNLRTSSPEMRKAYAQRFPVENFAMEMGPTIMGAITGIPLGLLERGFDATKRGFDFAKSGAGQGLDSLVSGIDKGMGAVESGLDFLTGKASDVKDDAVDIFKEATTKRQEPSTFTAQNRPVLFNDASDNPLEQLIIDSQSVDTPGIERIFKLPSDFRGDFNNMYFTGVRDPSLKENYLVNNPNLQSLIGMNLNQGGLASLNNPDYNRLMGASNFGF